MEVYTKSDKYRSEASLSQLEKELEPELFYRVNRNCIVNLKFIAHYKEGKIIIDEENLHVSLRRKKDFSFVIKKESLKRSTRGKYITFFEDMFVI